ncbi:XdhC family protein [Paenibacillus sp. LHD-117]|uniref:XdhC family protein n=1 Tax=Paenibacillus sp. LHD-117 TaxID=3071412 RepID=UPI0027E1C08E|nr:XdhC family protein [Paenibacillus sp. LHD-117]MDQ6419139.1 XdhC family protein [Paenibacillus sp. LHD-117]
MEAADLIKKALSLAGKAVLTTIVRVEGHAYRKAGASMLLEAGGGTSGSVSPGCLEADLKHYADPVLKAGTPQWIEYDMRAEDDLSWGEGIGCGGLVRILLEPVAGGLLIALAEADRLLDRGITVRLVREYGDSMLPSAYSVQAAPNGLEEPQEAGGRFVQRLEPKPRVVLFGGGDDAVPVARLVQLAGFRLAVADFREAVCKPERFPGAELHFGFPSEIMASLALSKGDYVLIMSHQFQRDNEFLKLALNFGPHYIGVMGSTSRTRRMFPSEDIPPSVHYPVGLPIGADGPEEIAISIVAELVGIRRKGHAAEGAAYRGGLFGSRLEPANGQAEAVD